MSDKKTPAAKKAAKKKAPAAKKAPEKPADEKSPQEHWDESAVAVAPAAEVKNEASLIYQVIKPDGTKYKTMNLGKGWTGPLPDSAVAEALVKIGHIQVIGAA